MPPHSPAAAALSRAMPRDIKWQQGNAHAVWEEFGERAAIFEFEGSMTRSDAEWAAAALVAERYGIGPVGPDV